MHAQVYFPSPIILKRSFNDWPDIPDPSYTSYCIPPVLRDWIASGPRTRRTSCSFSRRESQCWGTSELTATESSCFGQMSHGNRDPNHNQCITYGLRFPGWNSMMRQTRWWAGCSERHPWGCSYAKKRVEEWLVCLARRYHTNWNSWSTDAFRNSA